MSSDLPVASDTARPRPRSWGQLGMTVLIAVGAVGACALALLVALFFGRLSYQNFRIEGATMQPTIQRGDYTLVSLRAYLGGGAPFPRPPMSHKSWSC